MDSARRFQSLTGDSLIREIKTGRIAPVDDFETVELDVDFSQDGSRMSLSHDHETMDINDVLAGRKLLSFDPRKHGADATPNSSKGVSLGRKYFFRRDQIAGSEVFRQYNMATGSPVKLLPIPDPDSRVAFSVVSRAENFVVAENSDSLRVWWAE